MCVGIGLGKFLEKNRAEYLAERDAVLRHYIEIHREDFPIPGIKNFIYYLVEQISEYNFSFVCYRT